MNEITATISQVPIVTPLSSVSRNYLNCYELSAPVELAWPVSTYLVTRTDGQAQTHTDRGEIKNIIWKLYARHKNRCRGFGFVVDVSERIVAVPATWDLP